jgi:hypothetical protein
MTAAAVGLVAPGLWAGPPALFDGAAGPTVLGDPTRPEVVRSRTVSADLDLLAAADAGTRLMLNVFDDVNVVAAIDRTHWTNGSCVSVNGCLEGQPDSLVTFVVNEDEMTGIVRAPGLGTYRVRTTGGGLAEVAELDGAAFPVCADDGGMGVVGGGGGWADPGPDGPAEPDPCDAGNQIDVLIVYTSQARTGAGGVAAIEAEAQLAVDMANAAYANSGITPRLRLVHLAETSYNESGTYFDHLNRLTFVDGFMDEVHTLRDDYGADVVSLFVADAQYCGLAWVMTNPSASFQSHAFSVTTWFCAAGNLSFAHEVGHNMGSCHDHDNCSGGAFSYSWGHRFNGLSTQQFRTVMAYSPGTRIPYFSNPDVLYDGTATGVASGPTAADNARSIDDTAPTMANFRCAVSADDGLYVGPLGGDWFDPANWAGGAVPGAATDVTIPRLVTVSGAAATAASVSFTDGGAITISLGGSLAADDVTLASGSNLFVLDGSLTVTGGIIVRDDAALGLLDATSAVTAATITIESGAVATGPGTLTADVTNAGEIRPGLPLGPLAIVGSYTQQAGGTLKIELESLTPSDQLTVTGAATLGGELEVTVSSTTPDMGECFTLLTAASVTGTFGRVTVPLISFGEEIALTMSGTDVTACVQAKGSAGIVGEASGDRFTRALANAGDVDQDGYDDVIVGAPYNDEGGASAGKAYVYSGRTGAQIYAKRGGQEGERFGWAVASAGDANRDGYDDFVVAAPYRSNKRGRIKVFSGADGSVLFSKDGDASGDRFGYSVSGGIDVNADGWDDVIVGAPWNDGGASNAGAVVVLSGRNGARLGHVYGENSGDKYGWCVAAIGKANGDDYGDFAVGAPRNDDRGSNAGKVYVHSGRNLAVLYRLKGRRAGDQFGRAIAGTGRMNDDGRDDLIVGSPYYDKSGGTNHGRVDAYSGRDGTRLWSKNGAAADDRLGWSVAGAGGDADADGRKDVVIGAPRHDAGGTDTGRMYVRSGANGGLIYSADGENADDQLGYTVAGLGDIDDDDTADAGAGAPNNDEVPSNAGRLYVVIAAFADEMPAGDAPAPPAAPADGDDVLDVDGDGVVTAADLMAFLAAWGDEDPAADLNDDGEIDELDLVEYLSGP